MLWDVLSGLQQWAGWHVKIGNSGDRISAATRLGALPEGQSPMPKSIVPASVDASICGSPASDLVLRNSPPSSESRIGLVVWIGIYPIRVCVDTTLHSFKCFSQHQQPTTIQSRFRLSDMLSNCNRSNRTVLMLHWSRFVDYYLQSFSRSVSCKTNREVPIYLNTQSY